MFLGFMVFSVVYIECVLFLLCTSAGRADAPPPRAGGSSGDTRSRSARAASSSATSRTAGSSTSTSSRPAPSLSSSSRCTKCVLVSLSQTLSEQIPDLLLAAGCLRRRHGGHCGRRRRRAHAGHPALDLHLLLDLHRLQCDRPLGLGLERLALRARCVVVVVSLVLENLLKLSRAGLTELLTCR